MVTEDTVTMNQSKTRPEHWSMLTKWELTKSDVDKMRIDKVGIDDVGVDQMGRHLNTKIVSESLHKA